MVANVNAAVAMDCLKKPEDAVAISVDVGHVTAADILLRDRISRNKYKSMYMCLSVMIKIKQKSAVTRVMFNQFP